MPYLCTHKGTGCSAVGSAHVWGARGRKFESCHPDLIKSTESLTILGAFSFFSAPLVNCGKKSLLDVYLFLSRMRAYAQVEFFKFTTTTLTLMLKILIINVLKGGCSNLKK